jgi:integrase
MKMHHPDNERIKRPYFGYLREALGYSEDTLDSVASDIASFEISTRHRDFRTFRPEQAKAFKARLNDRIGVRSGKRLSKATVCKTLRNLRAFFRWLAGQPGYRSKLTYADADYFNPTENDARIARARREPPVPTLEQIFLVLSLMPANTHIELRNRAVVAFIILTGARDGAVASLKLKHVDLELRKVVQDAREVRTKGRKTFTTWFFPVDEEALRIVSEWITHLREELHWGNDDPLFPSTRVAPGPNNSFQAVGFERECWTTAQPIRDIFRAAFVRAELPYFNPHSFRNTLAQLGERICPNAEALKAWSQNLGHSQVLTTLMSYGAVAPARQAELILSLARRSKPKQDVIRRIREVLEGFSEES